MGSHDLTSKISIPLQSHPKSILHEIEQETCLQDHKILLSCDQSWQPWGDQNMKHWDKIDRKQKLETKLTVSVAPKMRRARREKMVKTSFENISQTFSKTSFWHEVATKIFKKNFRKPSQIISQTGLVNRVGFGS